jgi:excisionase family DNA binding protein
MLSLSEAAGRLGVTAATLRQQVHAGRLKARKLGSQWVVDEEDLAAYRLHSSGRVGRPFAGRPGRVDTAHVRVRLFLAPADGRGHDAIWLQYLRESFVLDLDYRDPRPFRPTQATYEALDLLTGTPPGGREFEFWNREDLALELGASALAVEILPAHDPTFPQPVVTFRDGPIWDAAQVQRWQGRHGPAERLSLPVPG